MNLNREITYKLVPQILIIIIGFGLGLVNYDKFARPLIIVGGATLGTTILKNGLIDWLIEDIIYDTGEGLSKNGKTLLESTLGVSLTAYLFIAPQRVSTAMATITIIGLLIWIYIRIASPGSIPGWILLSSIVVVFLISLFILLIPIFESISNIFVWTLVVIIILLLISGLYRDFKQQDTPRL